MNRRDRRARLQAKAAELFEAAEGEPHKLAMIAAQYAAAVDRHGGALEVQGIVSVHTGRPLVHMTWGAEQGQIDVEAARAHAMLILEAAQNAVADAALLEWARDELELDLDRASLMIDKLRQYRADRWGQPDLELERPPADEQET